MRKIFIIFFILLTASYTYGATWYASTDGSAACGTGCLTGAPCSLTTMLTCTVNPGDTVILKNGTYIDSGLIPTRSGSAGNYITIQAETEGLVIIDGQGGREPLRLTGITYNIIEGIIFQNGVYDTGKIHSSSQYNIVRRCGFKNAGSGNYHLMLLTGSDTANNLIEDCYATQGTGSGKNGRYGFVTFSQAHHNTIRRCYVKYYSHSGSGGPCAPFSAYNSNYNLFENCVADVTDATGECGGGYGERYFVNIPATTTATYDTFKGCIGISDGVYAISNYGPAGGTSSNITFIDNVWYNFSQGVLQEASPSATFTNNTIYQNVNKGYYCYGAGSTVTLKNSSFIGTQNPTLHDLVSGMTHTYNNIYGATACYTGTTQGTGENCNTLNPVYDTVTYGKGAYLMVPTALVGQGEGGADIGAKVLYRYVDGALTGTALWPWPMENRIVSELGVSVTYETNGGIWKTLTGVYGSDPPDPPPVVEKASMKWGASLSGGAPIQ